jgi:hypothetical protein
LSTERFIEIITHDPIEGDINRKLPPEMDERDALKVGRLIDPGRKLIEGTVKSR